MYTNVNLPASLGAVALLGTAFLLLVAAVVLAQSLIARKPVRARIAVIAMLGIAGLYLGAILVFSFASHEKVLAHGQEKHFCEIDCHLAYSIVSTRQAKTIGEGANQRSAQGQYTVITIKTRFDEDTISPGRGNGLLYPNSRVLTLIDQRGQRYGPAAQLGTPLTTSLCPGDSYTTEVAFDLPAGTTSQTLLINEGEWLTYLVIGHENSPLHRKTRFQV